MSQDTLPSSPAPHRKRWVICALLFFATTINYIDRQVLGLLKPELMSELGWNEIDYSNIVLAFTFAYALGYAGAGRFMDRVGVRLGFTVTVAFWSLATMAHALCRSVGGFMGARLALGLSEGGNFPGAIRTVGEWFPRHERALATGIFNAGSNVAVILTPLLVPLILVAWGWEAVFLIVGALGLAWLIPWQLFYRKRESDASATAANQPKVSWFSLLGRRQTWAFAAGMAMTSPIWWFYLFWVPGFFHDRYGLSISQFGPPLVTIYLLADVGSVGGGWLSSKLLKRGWSLNAARKTAMLVCAVLVVPVFFASQTSSIWVATVLIGFAAAAHQGFAANLFTLVTDTVPGHLVATVVGIGGLVSGLTAMVFQKATGYALEWMQESYVLLFGIASVAYLLCLLVIHLANPRHEPMTFPETDA